MDESRASPHTPSTAIAAAASDDRARTRPRPPARARPRAGAGGRRAGRAPRGRAFPPGRPRGLAVLSRGDGAHGPPGGSSSDAAKVSRHLSGELNSAAAARYSAASRDQFRRSRRCSDQAAPARATGTASDRAGTRPRSCPRPRTPGRCPAWPAPTRTRPGTAAPSAGASWRRSRARLNCRTVPAAALVIRLSLLVGVVECFSVVRGLAPRRREALQVGCGLRVGVRRAQLPQLRQLGPDLPVQVRRVRSARPRPPAIAARPSSTAWTAGSAAAAPGSRR